MTKQDVYECDICHEIKYYPQWSWIQLSITLNEQAHYLDYDLCHSCYDLILAVILKKQGEDA